MSEYFGTREPAKIWQSLIALCHRSSGPFISRLIAPIVRKIITRSPALLPIDIHVGGLNLRCYFIDNYSEKKFVFTPWRYDKQERELLAQVLEKGGTFVDIGANIGIYTLTAAKTMTGKKGIIIAFEPNPETFARLMFNLRSNIADFDNQPEIKALNIGVADKETTFTLQVDHANLGASSIRSKNRQQEKTAPGKTGTMEITCRPLLDILKEFSITRIDALKIDIEGAEDIALMPFLEKAPDSLLPGILLIENSAHLWERDVFGRAAERGYTKVFRNRMNTVLSLPDQHPE